jgi:hypothetical protein
VHLRASLKDVEKRKGPGGKQYTKLRYFRK